MNSIILSDLEFELELASHTFISPGIQGLVNFSPRTPSGIGMRIIRFADGVKQRDFYELLQETGRLYLKIANELYELIDTLFDEDNRLLCFQCAGNGGPLIFRRRLF